MGASGSIVRPAIGGCFGAARGTATRSGCFPPPAPGTALTAVTSSTALALPGPSNAMSFCLLPFRGSRGREPPGFTAHPDGPTPRPESRSLAASSNSRSRAMAVHRLLQFPDVFQGRLRDGARYSRRPLTRCLATASASGWRAPGESCGFPKRYTQIGQPGLGPNCGGGSAP